MVKSILQHNKACYICGNTLNLHRHHIFYGTANRKLSDEDGCVVYLCQLHHTGAAGVHFNKKIDLALKVKCQLQWQKHYNKTTEDFIRRYGRSYL
jgi:putative AlgH/UPF0301 family transcriptional regulator